MNTIDKHQILEQLAQINLMERGKLSPYQFKDRSANAPTHFKHQRWENGKNHTCHVSSEQLPLLREALAGFSKFQELTNQLAQVIIADTRKQLTEVRAGEKKTPRRQTSSWPKNKKSSS